MGLKQSVFFEGKESGVGSDDDVVENLDIENPGGVKKPARHLSIFLGRFCPA